MSAPQMITLEQATWAFIQSGVKKHEMEIGVRICKSFLAGVFLSLGGTLVDVLQSDPFYSSQAPGLLKIMQGAVFPVGLIMIVLFQVDLITTQMAIMIMATTKRKVPIWAFLIDWPVVFIGNLAGALSYTAIIVHFGGIYNSATQLGAATNADQKILDYNFLQIFLQGIGCNFCVCSAIFMAALAKDIISKIVSAWIPIFIFEACSYQHIIANMFFIPEGLLSGSKFSVGLYIWKSIIPVFLGNVVGAAFLVLPLVYIHGRDEFDPDNFGVEEIGSNSPVATVSGPVRKSEEWKNDIERSAAS